MIDDHVERTFQQVWKKNGVTYVPHYSKPDVFVGPGWSAKVTNKRGDITYTPMQYTLLELIAAGAVAGEMLLWPR
jgi:hypothetical protein